MPQSQGRSSLRFKKLWTGDLGRSYRSIAIYQPMQLPQPDKEQLRVVARLTNQLIVKRRAWLTDLYNAGSDVLEQESDRRWRQRFYCQPPGLDVPKYKQFDCRDPRLCCFCWSRMVFGDWYSRASWSLFYTQDDHVFELPEKQEVSFPDRQLITGEVELPVNLRRPLSSQIGFSRIIPNAFRSWIGAAQLSVAYVDRLKGPTVSRRFIAIANAGDNVDYDEIADYLGRDAKVVGYPRIDSAGLVDALTEVCYFPPQLSDGPIRRTVGLLNHVHHSRIRLVRTYGCLRSQSQCKIIMKSKART